MIAADAALSKRPGFNPDVEYDINGSPRAFNPATGPITNLGLDDSSDSDYDDSSDDNDTTSDSDCDSEYDCTCSSSDDCYEDSNSFASYPGKGTLSDIGTCIFSFSAICIDQSQGNSNPTEMSKLLIFLLTRPTRPQG